MVQSRRSEPDNGLARTRLRVRYVIEDQAFRAAEFTKDDGIHGDSRQQDIRPTADSITPGSATLPFDSGVPIISAAPRV
jgi:hypothetical protein